MKKVINISFAVIILAAFSVLFFRFNLSAPDEFEDGVIEVGVVTSDLQKSLDFYTNVLGMTKVSEFSVPGEKSKALGLTNNLDIDVSVLQLRDGAESTQWKLMSFGKKASHKQQKYIEDDTGMQYVTINVKSIKPFVERIKKAGVPMLGETPQPLGGGKHFILVQDPDGVFIEIIGKE